MTEMFPGQYPAGDQEQKIPETEYPADGESQADSLPPIDPESLQEDKGRLSRGIGNSALEASGVASPGRGYIARQFRSSKDIVACGGVTSEAGWLSGWRK